MFSSRPKKWYPVSRGYEKVKEAKELAKRNEIIKLGMQTDDEEKAWGQWREVVGRLVMENRELRYLAAFLSMACYLAPLLCLRYRLC